MNAPARSRFRAQGWPLALGLFLPTIYPSSEILWLPFIALWLAQRPKLRLYPVDALLVMFLGGVVILTLCGLVPQLAGGRPWSPAPFGYLLLPLSLLIGRSLRPATIRCLLGLICLEALVCGIQLVLRQPYVFAGQREAILNSGITEWGSTDLLYFNRMYGLSTNSSVAAQKFMLGMLLLFDLVARPRWRSLVFVLLAVGLYTTFNRTTLFAVGLYLGCKALGMLAQTSVRRQLQVLGLVALTAAVLVVRWPQVKDQFLRGNLDRSLVEESGRASLWQAAAETITTHPVGGNLSQRFQVYEYGEWFHLHSSWLQLVADHGVAGWLLIAHTFALPRRRNLAAFLALAFYSFVQFGLFGKISFINIVFYYLMRPPTAPAHRAKPRADPGPTQPQVVPGHTLPAA